MTAPARDDIAGRLARYGVSGDARDLWPDVPAAAFGAAQVAIADAAAAVLAGSTATLDLPAGVAPRALGVAASAAGMGPLLGWWAQAGALRAGPGTGDLLARHLAEGRRRASLLAAELDRVLAALAARGITVVLMKGMETAVRYFPEPGTRPCADIDLLVRPADAPAAADILRSLGFTGPHAAREQRGTWLPAGEQRVVSLDMAHADNPWSLDLHTALERTLPGGTRTPPIVPDVAACEPLLAFAVPVRVLPAPLELLFLALHTSYHFSTITLVRLVELVLVARAEFAGRDGRWAELAELMARYRAGRLAYPALALAERLAPGSIDGGVLRQAERDASPWLRRAVRARTPGTAQRLYPLERFEGLRWARTPGEVAAALAAMVWPRGQERGLGTRQVAGIYAARVRRLLGAVLRPFRR